MKDVANRWLRRIASLGVAALVAVVVAGASWEQWSRQGDVRRFPPPGELIEVGGRRMHLVCYGEGSPTVVFEEGAGDAGSQAWLEVQPQVSRVTRACSYDRSGILWSEPGRLTPDAIGTAEELHALLAGGGEAAPYVFVGFSMGGPLVRVYDDRFRGEVLGFVFIDSSHPEQLSRIPRQGDPPRSTPQWLQRAYARVGWARANTETDTPRDAFAIRGLPALLSFAGSVPTILAQAADTGSLGDRPLIVLTAGGQARHPNTQRVWLELQAEQARLSTNSDHRTVPGASHAIHVDDPAAVVEAILDVVLAVRAGGRVTDTGARSDQRPAP